MKKLSYILALAFLLTSCDQERDKMVFDPEDGQTFISFQGSSADLPVLIDDVGSVVIPVNSTTTAATDRVFTVSVVPELTTAEPASYSVGAINIPANSFTGTLTVDGFDAAVETTPELLVLQIDEQPHIVVSSDTFTLSIFQICPADENLPIGTYDSIADGDFGDGAGGAAGTYTNLPAVVTLTNMGNGIYEIDDMSFGLYPLVYGFAAPSGTIQNTCNEITGLGDTDQFGDPFTITGTVDGETGVISLSWSNTYGDTGTVTLTPQ